MSDKRKILTDLQDEFNRWDGLLASLGEADITARHLPSDLSVKDVVGHLRAWQQVSIARLEAAQQGREPAMPDWLAGGDPEDEPRIEEYNARIHETYRDRPWTQVYWEWKDGFLRLLQLGEAISGAELLDKEKYPWLKGHTLMDVLEGTLDHHLNEHREPLLRWLRSQGKANV